MTARTRLAAGIALIGAAAMLAGCASSAPFDITGTWTGTNYRVWGGIDGYGETPFTLEVTQTSGRGFVATVTYDENGAVSTDEVIGVVPEQGHFALLDNDDGVSSLEIIDANTITYCFKAIDMDLANCATLHRT